MPSQTNNIPQQVELISTFFRSPSTPGTYNLYRVKLANHTAVTVGTKFPISLFYIVRRTPLTKAVASFEVLQLGSVLGKKCCHGQGPVSPVFPTPGAERDTVDAHQNKILIASHTEYEISKAVFSDSFK